MSSPTASEEEAWQNLRNVIETTVQCVLSLSVRARLQQDGGVEFYGPYYHEETPEFREMMIGRESEMLALTP